MWDYLIIDLCIYFSVGLPHGEDIDSTVCNEEDMNVINAGGEGTRRDGVRGGVRSTGDMENVDRGMCIEKSVLPKCLPLKSQADKGYK